jgi:hypothetical protein
MIGRGAALSHHYSILRRQPKHDQVNDYRMPLRLSPCMWRQHLASRWLVLQELGYYVHRASD